MSAGVVVSRTDRELIPQAVLNRKPCLLGVSVLKVFPIWESKRLRNQRYRRAARTGGGGNPIFKEPPSNWGGGKPVLRNPETKILSHARRATTTACAPAPTQQTLCT